MTPRQAQIALLSFAILSAGIVFNALVLQRRPAGPAETALDNKATYAPFEPARDLRGPSPEAHRKRTSEGKREEPLRIARFAPDSAKLDLLPEAAEDQTDSATISAIQRELKQRNYGPIAVDGFLRTPTRAAIMAFEFDHGLPLTGEAREQTLKQILLGAPPNSAAAGAGKVASIHAETMIRSVQKSLLALGYRSGAADGQLGEDTSKAIRDFEMDRGLVPKGRVSAELLGRLADAQASAKR